MRVMEWVLLVVIGAAVGAAGRLLHPGPDRINLVLTLVIGIGSLGVAGAIFDSWWLRVIVGSVVATALLFAYAYWVNAQTRLPDQE